MFERRLLHGILSARYAACLLALFPAFSCRRVEPERMKLALQATFDSPGFSEDLMLASSQGQWGYFDRSGKLVIDLQAKGIESAWPFEGGMARFKQGNKYGFLDKDGNTAIPAKYDRAWSFSENVAPVLANGSWEFVDKSGNEAMAPRFANAHCFSDGLARVNVGGSVLGYLSSRSEITGYIMKGGKEGYIDRSGKLVIESKFDWALDFKDGFARVNRGGTLDEHGGIRGGKWGLIDKTGRVVVDAAFDEISSFEEGLASVRTGAAWGFIDTSGHNVILPRFTDYCHFSEGLAAVHEESRLYGYIDARGNYLIEPRFSVAGDFAEGLAPASTDGTSYGFIDKSGSWAIPPRFYMVEHFSEGFAVFHFPSNKDLVRQSFGHLCRHGGSLPSTIKSGNAQAGITMRYEEGGFVEVTKKSYIDRRGMQATVQYDDARGFQDGMAAVKINGKWGYLAVLAGPQR